MSRLPGFIKKGVRWVRARHTHVIAHASEGGSVAMFGDAGMRATLEEVYLGETSCRLQNSWHTDSLSSAMRRLSHRHGLAVCPATRLDSAQAKHALLVPRYVCMAIDLPETQQAFVSGLGSSAKADLRRISKQAFETQVCHDASVLAEFHARFHVPAIKSRHGARAYPASLADLEAAFAMEGAELLQVFLDGEWVGGVLNRADPVNYRLMRLGWQQGREDLLRKGVVNALYHACIERAFSLERHTLILGGTLPFLEDGVFAYKAKWGARLDVGETLYADSAWHVDPAHPHFRRFLQTHTLIARGANGRLVAYGARPPRIDRTYAPVMASLSAWYRLTGSPDHTRVLPAEVPAILHPWFVAD
jgi:hypothetical protein